MPRLHATLDSTALRSAAYDTESEDLDITFKSGSTFTYRRVPQEVFEALRDDPSPGTYFHQNIKNQYA